MNIFVLHDDPVQAAKYHCDRHVVKMILETGQMLSTALHHAKFHHSALYKPAFDNHPCNIWVRHSNENFIWTVTLFQALGEEYTYRYGKLHKTIDQLTPALNLALYANLFPDRGLTQRPLCMPDHHKTYPTAVECYRSYYHDKLHFAAYTHREWPEWLLKLPKELHA